MAVFRIEKTRDYTVMSNYHLRDRSLSLKAKGLLSLMLSLPEDWDYTMKGLARICKDGIDSISGGIRELESHGYLVRARVRNENGQLGSIEYTILEQPKEPAQTPAPIREKPIRENPIQVKPMLDAPIQENPAQLNTKEQNKELSITQGSSPILSSPPTPREKGRIGQDRMRERESYREIILENIDYDILTQDEKLDRDRLDELVELMVDTVCSNREMIRIAGDDYPAEVVKSRFLKIDSSHIEYVLERMRENTTYAIHLSFPPGNAVLMRDKAQKRHNTEGGDTIADYIRADTTLPAYLPYPRFLLKMEISQTAKLLYALLLDRSTLSQKNGWQDGEGRIFIVYPVAEIAEMLDKWLVRDLPPPFSGRSLPCLL